MVLTTPAGAAPPVPTMPGDTPGRVAASLRDQARQGTSAYGIVSELTTRFGPRLAGTPSEHQAAEWAAAMFRELRFDNVRVEQFPLQVWTRGAERAEILGPFPQPLTVTSLGGSLPTPAQGVTGEVRFFETLQDLRDADPQTLRGRIAVVLQETPRTQSGTGYGSSSAARSEGPLVAAEKGAVGYMLRSLGTHDHRFAHTGSTRINPKTVPAFALSPPDADQLRRVSQLGGSQLRVRLFSTHAAPVQGRSQNVIGEIRGRERPDEVIVIGAHLDSWDLGTGAIDDGAGVAIVTAAAQLIRQLPQRPRRTIRVVLFGAEEVSQPEPVRGLAGGRFYAAAYKDALRLHVAASESDFGAGPVYSFTMPAAAVGTPFLREATRALAPLGIFFDPAPSRRGGGPDIGPMSDQGVPTFRLNQDGTDYFDVHHTADDVLDRIDPKNLDQNVAAWAALLWLLAESDIDLRAEPAPATPAR